MRKLEILPLLVFFSVMIVFVACGFDLGPESSNEKVLRRHVGGLMWDLRLTCRYQEECDAKITPFVTLGPAEYPGVYYDRYEYEFDDGKTKETVTMGTTVPVTVDDDDHVRFSLFDSARVEKTYDIDLSEIIHSYTVKDDSVEIKKLDDLRQPLKISQNPPFTNKLIFSIFSLVTKMRLLYGPAQFFRPERQT